MTERTAPPIRWSDPHARFRSVTTRLKLVSHQAAKRAKETIAGRQFSGLITVRFGNSNRLWMYSPSQDIVKKMSMKTGDRRTELVEILETIYNTSLWLAAILETM